MSSQKTPTPSTEWMTITPERAKAILANNKSNRPLSDKAVRDIANRMQAGTWIETHQGIGIDANGDVVDGQHRLSAIVKSGIAHRYLVTIGLSPEVFDHVDLGGKGIRTAADLLSRRVPGLSSNVLACGVASMALRGVRVMGACDKVMVVDFIDLHRDMVMPFVSLMKGKAGGGVSTAPVIAAFVAACRPLDELGNFPGPKGGRLFESLFARASRFHAMDWRGGGDPLKTLFMRLLRDRDVQGHRADAHQTYGLTVGALRADMEGRSWTKANATTVDWGDKEDHMPAGTPAVALRRAITRSSRKVTT